jgi:heme-degrading monooxygenase HmoA
VIRLRGDASKTEEAIKLWSQEILPTIKKQSGFAGATLVGNRQTGEGLTVSYWETEQNMKEARAHVRPTAQNVLANTGGSIVEETECEVAVMERFQPPKAGVWARVTSLTADPSRVNEGVSTFKSKVVPVLARQPGVRSAFNFVNRQDGKAFAGSLWDTEKDLKASEAAIQDLRQDAIKQTGGQGAKTEVFEVYYTEIMAPAATSR